ncbi:MAG: FtsW/RodA/SpoVE family cell cycle protein [Flavobacteriaceae bacterium]|nr:FtsW/RodA/SpoVE family cell cycle protein [Flavobacteriaceae bacterium]
MNKYIQQIKGDKSIWAIAGILALLSFAPVYSSSSNLAYLYGSGNTSTYLIKHGVHLILGFIILFGVHKIPFNYFKALSIILLPVVIVLLIYTITQGTTIDGANASRWIQIPVVGITFQTSALAMVVLLVYVASYLTKIKDKVITLRESIIPLWLPVFLVVGLILPANFSTAAILFLMVILVVFMGGYPFKYIASVLGVGVILLALFVLTAKAFPGVFPNRVDTWISRVESFTDKKSTEEGYQIEKAKIAIATGGVTGLGPGKSVQKNFLPQSSSDFIFAVIIEEYGLLGALALIFFYTLLLVRILIVVGNTDSRFGKLVVIAVGIPIIFQSIINMAVAVELFPVTGQTLPLISSGGTSIWMTCLALGIILSVSAKRQEILKETNQENPLDILSETL